MGDVVKNAGIPAVLDRRDGGVTLTVWTLSGLAFLAACGGGGGGGGVANSNIRLVVSGTDQPGQRVPALGVVTTDTSVTEGGTSTTRDAKAHGRVTVTDHDNGQNGHVIQARGTSSSFTNGSNTANSNKGADIAGTYGTLYLKADYTFTYELYDETTTQGAALQALTRHSSDIFDVFAVRVENYPQTQTTIKIHVLGADDSDDGGGGGDGDGDGDGDGGDGGGDDGGGDGGGGGGGGGDGDGDGDGGASFTIPGDLMSTRNTPLYPNSVVSNDHDFIHTDDTSAFSSLTYEGTRDNVEMPDKRHNELFANGVYIFEAQYSDGVNLELWAHSDFGSPAAARTSVEPVAQAVGKLPSFMRSVLDHVVVHKGDETAQGEHLGHFFTVYSDNIQTRISNHDLEETVFHESVHATLDEKYRDHGEWRKAQQADGGYITEYAANRNTEDLAESALFAWALLMHPGRLPGTVESQVRAIMPNRLAFFEEMFKFEGLTLPQPQPAPDIATVSADDGVDGHDAAGTEFQQAVDII